MAFSGLMYRTHNNTRHSWNLLRLTEGDGVGDRATLWTCPVFPLCMYIYACMKSSVVRSKVGVNIRMNVDKWAIKIVIGVDIPVLVGIGMDFNVHSSIVLKVQALKVRAGLH